MNVIIIEENIGTCILEGRGSIFLCVLWQQ